MNPTVSILIPAYNAETWIADTIRSAIAQTGVSREIIIVDDGSTDGTLAVARQFSSADVLVISQSNHGASSARNRAFAASQGAYIQWLDADDVLAPNKAARQLEMTRGRATPRTLLSSAWGSFFYRTRKSTFRPHHLWQDLSPTEWLFHKLEGNLFMTNASWLVSRELTDAAGPWDERLSLDDDGEYFCRVLLASDGVLFTPEAESYYRSSSPGSLSQVDHSDQKLRSLVRSLHLHTQYLRRLEDTPRTRAACLEYLQRWLVYFTPERPDLIAELQTFAGELGGHLEAPPLRWKYAWLQSVLGERRALQAQFMAPRLKQSIRRRFDEALFHFDRLAGGRAG